MKAEYRENREGSENCYVAMQFQVFVNAFSSDQLITKRVLY